MSKTKKKKQSWSFDRADNKADKEKEPWLIYIILNIYYADLFMKQNKFEAWSNLYWCNGEES